VLPDANTINPAITSNNNRKSAI